jgi:hypothetical protein
MKKKDIEVEWVQEGGIMKWEGKGTGNRKKERLRKWTGRGGDRDDGSN